MYRYLYYILSILLYTSVYAQDYEILYDGISEDQRDYIIRYRVQGEVPVTEDHYTLYPYTQWRTPSVPSYHPYPYSTWKDYDGDGLYTEWYQHNYYGQGNRFIWDYDSNTYNAYPLPLGPILPHVYGPNIHSDSTGKPYSLYPW